MSFTNQYYKRAVGTPRACYVCYKPTTTVLATTNTVDFIYVCDIHLTDPGFATRVDDAASEKKAPSVSAEEIAKAKEEWEERQRRKQEKAKEKEEKDKGGKDKDGEDKDKKESKKASSSSPSSKSPPPTASSPGSASSGTTTPATTSTHQKYVLHRDIFSLRQAEHRKRRQAAQAQALAPRLPGAPKSPLPSSS